MCRRSRRRLTASDGRARTPRDNWRLDFSIPRLRPNRVVLMAKIVGVFPRHEINAQPQLFRALERVFDVRFDAREAGQWRGLDGALLFSDMRSNAVHPLPDSIPTFVLPDHKTPLQDVKSTQAVRFAASPHIDSRLHNRTLIERSAIPQTELPRQTGDSVVASVDGIPVWVVRNQKYRTDFAAIRPPELCGNESIADLLGAGRFLSLLPLIHFLRTLTGYNEWRKPDLRAAFVFDDPNLHWPSYGFLNFQRLAQAARNHGYHVVIAAIPLDLRYARASVVRTFHEAQNELSFTLHGNDHFYQEFTVPRSTEEALAIIDQAHRRACRFEHRWGLRISRVFVPPHGRCADAMLGPMALAGIEALCRSPVWWGDWPPDYRTVAGFAMANISPSGLPIMPRYRFNAPLVRDQTTLSIFLDQPVILYGHHDDVADGYAILSDLAAWLATFGDVAWMSLDRISRRNVISRQTGSCLTVRAMSRRFVVEVPRDAVEVVVEMPTYDNAELERVVCGRTTSRLAAAGTIASSEPLRVEPGARMEITLARHEPPVRRTAPGRSLSYRAVARRSVGEARDRVRPLIRTAGLEPVLRRMELAYDRRMKRKRAFDHGARR